jgi:hypothetical protein
MDLLQVMGLGTQVPEYDWGGGGCEWGGGGGAPPGAASGSCEEMTFQRRRSDWRDNGTLVLFREGRRLVNRGVATKARVLCGEMERDNNVLMIVQESR